ncbi:25911_t:CDS:1, partial [Racocetra persica]
DCLDNQYYSYNEFSHIKINKDQIEERRMTYHSRRRTHHCCNCCIPQQPDKLYKLEEKLACIACYKTYYEALDSENPRSQEYYNTELDRGTLV